MAEKAKMWALCDALQRFEEQFFWTPGGLICYGLSAGTPTLPTIKSDAIAACDFLKTLPIGDKPIIVHELPTPAQLKQLVVPDARRGQALARAFDE